MFPFNSATDASFSCGGNQTAAWSEIAGHNQQAAPLAVSTDLVWDMKGYSHFTVTRPRLDLRTHSQRVGKHRIRAAKSRGRQCWGIRPQPQLLM